MEGSLAAIYTDILVFVLLLFASGFFASSEVVFFSVSKPFLMKYSKSRLYRLLMELLSKPKEVLISILIGNELVNVLISSYGAKLFTENLGKEGALLSAVLMSFLIFIFGETLPKNAVLPVADRLSLIYTPVFYLFHTIIFPIRLIFLLPVQNLLKKLGVDSKEEVFELSEEKLLGIIEMGIDAGEFSEDERIMIKKVFEMDEVLVREIMTPRPDIFALPENLKVGEVIEEVRGKGHSRIPVYKEKLDDVTGVVHVKDLLPVNRNKDRVLGEFKREVLFVPEVMSVESLLQELRKAKTQMAIVVDEHGAVSGLVTMYDVLRWLLGDVPEEWEEEKEIEKLSYDMFRIEGSADIEEVAEALGFELPEEYDYDTVSGFVMANLNKVPEKGDEFEYDGFKFIVGEVEKNRVKEVIVKVLKRAEEKT
ncbi:CBS domain containing-hemolysin-like protein [Hydrogenivirga caldilitoris]|uniref:CBS domain containing-hemolysin-like protein n=1 Tax=Hydrogenivirga caldilitoris TaxID=246264 RepID=A0A497XQT8_9AQUI|nr:hemolysin family protein [Hydrogenivirga caldilitoris]RLJ70624.1 CBS domain containing-hemolysin-like protein [Hydrogenivirga caldilitoris]